MLKQPTDKPQTFCGADLRQLQPALIQHLVPQRHWVNWKWEKNPKGKWTKPPYIASGASRYAKNNDLKTWRTFDQACVTFEKQRADGIGFMLLGTDLATFDIDDCRHPETGQIAPYALQLVERANTYTEITVGGRGLRIIGIGSKRHLHRKIKIPNSSVSVEAYRNCERFITISNLPLDGVTTDLNNIDALLDEVVAEFGGVQASEPPQQGEAIDDAAFVYLKASLPLDLLALISKGVPDSEDRSAAFFHVVAWLKDEGWSVADIVKLLGEYPDGIRARYPKYAAQVRACYGKAEQKPADTDVDDKNIITNKSDAISKLNENYALVIIGDKTAVMKQHGNEISFMAVKTFETWFANRYVRLEDRNARLGAYWLGHSRRRQYEGISFAPRVDRLPHGHFNLWRGFAVHPKPGDCSKFLAHIKDNVCCGDPALANWVIGWFAHIIQHPDEKMGTSLVLRGKQGTGKTKVGEVVGSLLGTHYQPIADPRYITGRFNSHLVSCLLLHADEAFWAGDHAAEGKLKDLVTGHWQQIEFKGKEPVRIRNFVRLLVCGNPDWLVPAAFGERRFAILDVGDAHKEDKPYFAAIDHEMDHGGREALLHFLLNFDLTAVDLRTIPKTAALLDQKVASMTPEQSWWMDTLMRGELPWGCDEPNRCPAARLFDRYISRAMRQGAKRRSIETQLGAFLKKNVPGLRRPRSSYPIPRGKGATERPWHYVFPVLADCRKAFERELEQPIDWGDDSAADWTREPMPDRPDEPMPDRPDEVPF